MKNEDFQDFKEVVSRIKYACGAFNLRRFRENQDNKGKDEPRKVITSLH